MSTEIQTRPARSMALQVKDWLSAPAMQTALRAALAGYMDEATFAAQCYLAAQDPKLAACKPESLFRAFLECAQMGLLPGAHHKHVALVPRAGIVTAVPQWQGFKFLIERQPEVRRVLPVLVHARDTFAFANGLLDHRFDPFDSERRFEHPDVAAKVGRACELRGGYLVIERTDEPAPEYHFVTADKIHRNRLCAETQRVWQAWFAEMTLKTILRDAWARRVVSIDPQLATRIGRAEAADNAALGNDPARAELPQAATVVSRVAALEARIAAQSAALGDGQLPDLSKLEPTPLATAEQATDTAVKPSTSG